MRLEVPTKVAINEALELAKRYSTAQSSRFVNGILDRLQAAGIAQLAKEAARHTWPASPGRGLEEPGVLDSEPVAEDSVTSATGKSSSRTNPPLQPRRKSLEVPPWGAACGSLLSRTPPVRGLRLVEDRGGRSSTFTPLPLSTGRLFARARTSEDRPGPPPTLASLATSPITDHDTLSAIAVARPEAVRVGVELIPGVELTAVREGRELHILGHFVRDNDPGLVAACVQLREARARRIAEMAGRLGDLGLSVDLETLRRTFPRATLGRKHLADWLVKTGQVPTHREAFLRYLGDDGPAQVEKPRLPWTRAIALIRAAGGVAGLAHPPYDLRSNTLRELVDAGLGSIEVGGPGIDARVGRRWRAWAIEMGLAPIAGTDFHSSDRPGRWVGARPPPPRMTWGGGGGGLPLAGCASGPDRWKVVRESVLHVVDGG